MDIPALSMAMAQTKITNEFQVAMLSNSLDTLDQAGDFVTKAMMEQSVNPELGANIDVSV